MNSDYSSSPSTSQTNSAVADTRLRQVHKFGGSSLADEQCYRRVASILQNHSRPGDLVIVSASGKTTDRLVQWLDEVTAKSRSAQKYLDRLYDFQVRLIRSVLRDDTAAVLIKQLNCDLRRLAHLAAEGGHDADLLGYGEVWSARLLTAFLTQQHMPAETLDPRAFLLIGSNGALPIVDYHNSSKRLAPLLNRPVQRRIIVPGFMGADAAGNTVLLGRNGSDYSATATARAAGTTSVTIWSDVDGVYTADPRQMPSAKRLPSLTTSEANELSRLGASVLHQRTLHPLDTAKLEVQLRSSHEPNVGGTKVVGISDATPSAKSVTTCQDLRVVVVGDADTTPSETTALLELLACDDATKPLLQSYSLDRDEVVLAYRDGGECEAIRRLSDSSVKFRIASSNYALIGVVGHGVGDQAHIRSVFVDVAIATDALAWSDSSLSLVALVPGERCESTATQLHTLIFDHLD